MVRAPKTPPGAETPRRGRPPGSFSARSQIVFGAAEAFGEKGYGDTSVEDILRAADVSRRTFYRFFRNKEQVFEALFEVASMIFLQSIRQAAAVAETPLAKVASCIDVYLRFPSSAGPIFRVLHLEATRPGSKVGPQRAAVIEALIGIFDQEVAVAQGRRVDPLVFRGLIAALESITLHVITDTTGSEADLLRARRAMLAILVSTLGQEGDPRVPLPQLEPPPDAPAGRKGGARMTRGR